MRLRVPNPLGAAAGLACLLPASSGLFGFDGAFGAAAGFIGAATLWTQPAPWETRRPARGAATLFGALQLAAVLSAVWAAAFLGATTLWLDLPPLAKPALLGVLAAYALRYYDGHVRATLDAALAAAVYVSWVYRGPEDFGAFAAPAVCWMLFFSRTRLRRLHAAAGLAACALRGDAASWAAAALAVGAAAGWEAHERLLRRGAGRRAAVLGAAAAAALFALARNAPVPANAVRPAVSAMAAHAQARSPLLGWGPATAERLPERGSQWTQWRLRGGLLRAALWALGLAWAAAELLRSARGRARAGAAALAGGFLFLLGGSPALDSTRVFLVWTLLAVGAARAGAQP